MMLTMREICDRLLSLETKNAGLAELVKLQDKRLTELGAKLQDSSSSKRLAEALALKAQDSEQVSKLRAELLEHEELILNLDAVITEMRQSTVVVRKPAARKKGVSPEWITHNRPRFIALLLSKQHAVGQKDLSKEMHSDPQYVKWLLLQGAELGWIDVVQVLVPLGKNTRPVNAYKASQKLRDDPEGWRRSELAGE